MAALLLNSVPSIPMSGPATVLLVHADAAVAARLGACLASAGYATATATSFDEAKALIAASPPALLVASVRLGAYNGLHLIVRSRMDQPETAAILLSHRPDPVFETEAAKYGAIFMTEAESDERLVATAARLLSSAAL